MRASSLAWPVRVCYDFDRHFCRPRIIYLIIFNWILKLPVKAIDGGFHFSLLSICSLRSLTPHTSQPASQLASQARANVLRCGSDKFTPFALCCIRITEWHSNHVQSESAQSVYYGNKRYGKVKQNPFWVESGWRRAGRQFPRTRDINQRPHSHVIPQRGFVQQILWELIRAR